MTPEEAINLYCPMTFNNPNPAWDRCRGTGCMAWRKLLSLKIQEIETVRVVEQGYCGAFGKDGAS